MNLFFAQISSLNITNEIQLFKYKFSKYCLLEMSVINEISQITPAQMGQFMPKERFNVAKSTIQKTKSTITSLNSGIVTDNFKNTASTPYDFVIGGGNTMGVIDLSQCYFNIAGTLQLTDDNGTAIRVAAQNIALGNLFISSLFQ